MKKYKQFLFESNNDFVKWYSGVATIPELTAILKRGFDINKPNMDGGWNRLMYAAADNETAILKFLLEQPGIDVNYQDLIGWTALIVAAKNGRIESLKMLLEDPRIDITLKTIKNETVFDYFKYDIKNEIINYSLQKKILDNGREDIIVAFEKYGLVHPKIKEENPDLFKAAGWGLIGESNFDYDKWYEDRKKGRVENKNKYHTNIDYSNKYKEHQWIIANNCDDINKIRQLLEEGFDPNYKYNHTYSIIESSTYGHNEILKMLLKHPDIKVNIKNNYGNTALTAAAPNGERESIVLLLQHPDIDVYIKDRKQDDYFLDHMYGGKEFLIDYDLQKVIIENNEKNILLFEKYGLVHPKIKEENPYLFKAKEWGLI